MRFTLLPEDMARVERRSMQTTGTTALTLMERAAAHLADAAAPYLSAGGSLLAVCGAGNNGGDGLATTRLLLDRLLGLRATLWLLPGTPTAETAEQHHRLLPYAARVQTVLLTADAVPPAVPPETACALDALFGTGLNRPLGGAARMAVEALNRSGVPVVAADIPSGLDGRTGNVLGGTEGAPAVHAAVTVTFHRLKPGLLLQDGLDCCGRPVVADIGIDPATDDVPGMAVLCEGDRLLPPRARNTHKGAYGRLLVLAGSPGMAGAASLCTLAALRTGAGLVTVACPQSVMPVVQTLCPCATCLPLPEESAGQRIATAVNPAAQQCAEAVDALDTLKPEGAQHAAMQASVLALNATPAAPPAVQAHMPPKAGESVDLTNRAIDRATPDQTIASVAPPFIYRDAETASPVQPAPDCAGQKGTPTQTKTETESTASALDAEAWALLEPALRKADALVVGCGLGQGRLASGLLERLLLWLQTHPLPTVLDADALNLLSRRQTAQLPGCVVLTPHAGEAARLLHTPVADVLRDLPQAARALHQAFGCAVVLKSAATVLIADDGEAISPYGTPGMAKGGSGDTLAGVLGALLAGRAAYSLDGMRLLQSGCALHGLAGMLAVETTGIRGLLASDLCEAIGRVPDCVPPSYAPCAPPAPQGQADSLNAPFSAAGGGSLLSGRGKRNRAHPLAGASHLLQTVEDELFDPDAISVYIASGEAENLAHSGIAARSPAPEPRDPRAPLGRRVRVTVDRPVGSRHPEHSELHYLLNHGYVADVLASDNEWQDAYVLGVFTPLELFEGEVVAVIHRLDGTEDQWIVAAPGARPTADEVRTATAFAEQYYRTEIWV